MTLISKGDHFELYDDPPHGRILVLLKSQGPQYLTLTLERPKTRLGVKLIEYMLEAFKSRRGRAPLVLENASIMKVAEYLYRSKSRSLQSLQEYAWSIGSFSDYVHKAPDVLIQECLTTEGLPNPMTIHSMGEAIDRWMGEMEAVDLAPGSIVVRGAHIKTFFRVNGIALEPLRRYSLRVRYRDRAPKPEEVQRILEVADLRERAMVAMLATSGMRIGTLLKLKYRHVREDLEAGRTPLHIHVEAEITKGKYADYDTFINEEATHCLRLYLDDRRRGAIRSSPRRSPRIAPFSSGWRVKGGPSA